MKKIKYEDAVMEIVKFDFEDVLDASLNENIGDGSQLDGDDGKPAEGNPWDGV